MSDYSQHCSDVADRLEERFLAREHQADLLERRIAASEAKYGPDDFDGCIAPVIPLDRLGLVPDDSCRRFGDDPYTEQLRAGGDR